MDAERRDAAGVHGPLDADPFRGLEDGPGSGHVGPVVVLRPGPVVVHQAGHVVQLSAPCHRLGEKVRVVQLAPNDRYPEGLQVARIARRPRDCGNRVTLLDQHIRQPAPDEPRAACQKNSRHPKPPAQGRDSGPLDHILRLDLHALEQSEVNSLTRTCQRAPPTRNLYQITSCDRNRHSRERGNPGRQRPSVCCPPSNLGQPPAPPRP